MTDKKPPRIRDFSQTGSEVTESKVEEAVSRSQRSVPGANAAFRNPNDLDFPQDMVDYFKKQGFNLRWVLCMDHKTHAFTNQRINFFLGMGGKLVTPRDVKQVNPSFLAGLIKYDYREDFADEDDRSKGQTTGIRKDDLVLMAIPAAYREYRRKTNEQLVREQLDAAERKYGERSLEVKKNKHGSMDIPIKAGFFDD